MNQWMNPAGVSPERIRRGLALGAILLLWWDPSGGLTSALLAGLGVYALLNVRKTAAAWRHPAGVLFGLGVLWAVLSLAWSFDTGGTGRDLSKSLPMVLGVFALPLILDRPGRIWFALTASAGAVTVRLALDLIRVFRALGWPEVLSEARYFQTYLYTHPNVSSMMAGLCVLILLARGLAGAPGLLRKLALAMGIGVNLAYLLVMASRGPQVVFALMMLVFPVLVLPGWRARLAMAGLSLLLGAALLPVAYWVNPRFSDKTMFNFNRRDTIWGHARMLADRRPVLGYGFGKKAFVKAVYENPEQRAPMVPVHYPHTHSYWLMLYFQGGRVGFLLWSLGWLALGLRLACTTRRFERAESSWAGRLRARALPVLLGLGAAGILVYGIMDFPDHALRQAQFYLLGTGMGLTAWRPASTENDA